MQALTTRPYLPFEFLASMITHDYERERTQLEDSAEETTALQAYQPLAPHDVLRKATLIALGEMNFVYACIKEIESIRNTVIADEHSSLLSKSIAYIVNLAACYLLLSPLVIEAVVRQALGLLLLYLPVFRAPMLPIEQELTSAVSSNAKEIEFYQKNKRLIEMLNLSLSFALSAITELALYHLPLGLAPCSSTFDIQPFTEDFGPLFPSRLFGCEGARFVHARALNFVKRFFDCGWDYNRKMICPSTVVATYSPLNPLDTLMRRMLPNEEASRGVGEIELKSALFFSNHRVALHLIQKASTRESVIKAYREYNRYLNCRLEGQPFQLAPDKESLQQSQFVMVNDDDESDGDRSDQY